MYTYTDIVLHRYKQERGAHQMCLLALLLILLSSMHVYDLALLSVERVMVRFVTVRAADVLWRQ